MSGAPLELELELLLDDELLDELELEELELELLLDEELELLDEELELLELEEELLDELELELLLDDELLGAPQMAVGLLHFVQIPVEQPLAGIESIGQLQFASADEVATPGVPVNVTPGTCGVHVATYCVPGLACAAACTAAEGLKSPQSDTVAHTEPLPCCITQTAPPPELLDELEVPSVQHFNPMEQYPSPPPHVQPDGH